MSERKFKIGDIVKPIKTDPDSHIFEEWEILKITRVSDGDRNLFECTRESDGHWDLLWDFELELVEDGDEEVKRELRVGDRVEMVRFDMLPFSHDKIGNTGTVVSIGGGLIDVKVDGVFQHYCENRNDCECDVFPYTIDGEVWQLLEEPKTYTHEEVAEILGVQKNQVETISVDISDKPFEEKEPDMVNHPKHYTKGGIETLDFILAKVEGLPPQEAVLVGHIIRYVSRYNDKFKPLEDLKKARFYLEKLIEMREKLEK